MNTHHLGQRISVRMDRPLGSRHPEWGFEYPVNYGYVPGTLAPDGEELDAYVLGVEEPLAGFEGTCIAVIHRLDDDDDKLVVVPEGAAFSDAEIRTLTHFQEQYFRSVILRSRSTPSGKVDPMLIRPARFEDARNLAALAIQVWLHTYATEGLRDALSAFVLEAFTPETFLARMEDPQRQLLVAEHNGHLVGYAELDFEAPREDVPGVRTELATLYVQEHFAGQGIGKRLLEACAEEAQRRTGSAAYWLSVYHGNANAIAFYHKQGFTERGAFDFEFGGERHRNLVMARDWDHVAIDVHKKDS